MWTRIIVLSLVLLGASRSVNAKNLRSDTTLLFPLKLESLFNISIEQIPGDKQAIQAFFDYANDQLKDIQYLLGGTPPTTPAKQDVDFSIICSGCQAFYWVLHQVPTGLLMKIVDLIAFEVCKQGQDAEVCSGVLEYLVPIYATTIFKRLFDPTKACPALHMCEPFYKVWPLKQFIDDTLKDRPNKTTPKPTRRANHTVLHLTDSHLDLLYQEGTNEDCPEPICCRNGTGKAGFWGFPGKNCDLPVRSLQYVLKYIKKNIPEIDMILWTGDNIAHDIWKQTFDNQTTPTRVVANLIKSIFGTDIVMVGSIGNHECFPVNEYDFLTNRENWMKNEFADIMAPWTKNETDLKQLREKGFYSIVDPRYNLRILSINSQAGSTQNMFLNLNPTDPFDMLDWMFKELKLTEDLNQTAYIIGHIPVGDQLYGWGKRYNLVVERFSHIIRGQFYGHTHHDHFEVQHGERNKSEVIGVQHIGPSQSYYDKRVPGFKVYKIDVDTNHVLNYDLYHMIHEKSTRDDLYIEKAYDFCSEYGYKEEELDVFYSFEDLAKRIGVDVALAQKMHDNMYNGGPVRKRRGGRKGPHKAKEVPWNVGLMCDLLTGDYKEMYECRNETMKDNSDYFQDYLQEVVFQGEWYKNLNSSETQDQ